jgi:hypothetical protein
MKTRKDSELLGTYSSNQYKVLYALGILKKLRENECRPS